jgi:hypothetical protein
MMKCASKLELLQMAKLFYISVLAQSLLLSFCDESEIRQVLRIQWISLATAFSIQNDSTI